MHTDRRTACVVGASRPPSLRRSFYSAVVPFLLALLVCIAIPVHAGQPDDPVELLRLLEEGDFDARKAVEKRLEELGEASRAALEKAAQSPSPELRQTAARLLNRLSQATLTVEFFARDGKPLAGVNVQASLFDSDSSIQAAIQEGADDDEEPPAKLITDDQGRLQFSARPPGNYNLSLNAEGFTVVPHASRGANMVVLLQSGANHYRVQLDACTGLTGTVQREDGTPLGDAVITYMQAFQPLEKEIDFNAVYVNGAQHNDGASVNTDKTGAFDIRNLTPGPYHVFAQHPDYETAPLASVQITAGEKNVLPAVKLTRRTHAAGAVRIKLTDEKGEPVANRALSAQFHARHTPEQAAKALRTLEALHRQGRYDEPNELTAIAVETNEHGEAEIKEIPTGTYDVVLSDEDRERFYFAPNVISENAPPDRPAIKPATLGAIEGRLTGSNGVGLANRSVCALDESQPLTQLLLKNPDRLTTFAYSIDEFARTSNTDEDGKYSVEGLPPGKYALVFLSESQPVALLPHLDVALAKKTPAPPMVLDTAAAENFIAQGKVLLHDRTPAANAMVYLVDRHGSSTAVNTSADGSFNTSWSAQPPVWLGVVAQGHAPLTQEFRGENGAMEIVLNKEAPGTLRVTALHDDGRPASAAVVQVLPAHQPGFVNPDSSLRPANAAGQLLLRNLRPGKFRVRVWNAARTAYAVSEVDVRSSEEARCDIKLPAPARLTGQIVLPAGEAPDANVFARAQIVLVRENDVSGDEDTGTGSALLTPNATGRFSSGPLAPGKYSVAAFGAGRVFANAKRIVTLEAGATVTFDVTLSPSCSILVDGGASAALSMVSADAPGLWRPQAPRNPAVDETYQPTASDRVGFNGRALLEGLPPGTYDLTLKQESSNDLQNGRTSEVVRVLRNVRVGPEHAKKPLEVRLPELPETAAATIAGGFALSPDSWKELNTGAPDYSMVTLKVAFIGADQYALASMVLSESLNRGKIKLVGQPEGPHGESFTLAGLGAGEVTCEAWLEWLVQDGDAWKTNSEKVQLTGLAPKLTLTAGQTFDLKALLINVPRDLMDRLAKESQRRTEQTMRQNLLYATQVQPIDNFQP